MEFFSEQMWVRNLTNIKFENLANIMYLKIMMCFNTSLLPKHK